MEQGRPEAGLVDPEADQASNPPVGTLTQTRGVGAARARAQQHFLPHFSTAPNPIICCACYLILRGHPTCKSPGSSKSIDDAKLSTLVN